jgi:hypothetical protein
MPTVARSGKDQTAPVPTPRPEVRHAVKKLLTQTPAFAQLTPERQQQTARDTALIADYLAAHEGFTGLGSEPKTATGRALAGEAEGGVTATSDRGWEAVSDISNSKFQAGAAREGAQVAQLFMKSVDFVQFVGGLIQGVFSSIVSSSIQQMEAYSKMVEQVAKSLQQFRDDNVTENQGRDHMVERFPDVFEIGVDEFAETPGPRLKLKDGVDEAQALKQVRTAMKFEDGKLDSVDVSDENVEKMLVIAARTQLARQRQQLLASLVIMGINRIVVTDGKISAKIMYDFQARDVSSRRRTATAFDYATQDGRVATTWEGEGTYDSGATRSGSYDQGKGDYSADYYSKGEYKYAQKPIMTAMSTASEASDSQLQTRAQLAGAVEVNFKSDYLPLDKMATPGMIAAIQGNSTPVDPNVVPSPRSQPAANAQAPAGTTTPATT